MHTTHRLALTAALVTILICAGFVALPGNAGAARGLAKQEAMSLPVLTLKHWQASERSNKLAFLFGFTTMVELEKEWQGNNALPVSQSINSTWVKGLDGVSLGEMCSALDAYAAQHTATPDMPVLEALGRIYIQPKLTPAERQMASTRAAQIRTVR